MMALSGSSPERVSPGQALAALLAWWNDGDRRRVAELVGPPGSGRTEVLTRVREAVPEAVWVDATDLTAEEIVQCVVEASGAQAPPWRRADWGRMVRKTGLGDGPVIICNAHRAGRTRRSAQPERVVRDLTMALASSARLKVIVEGGQAGVRPRNLVLALDPEPAREDRGAHRTNEALPTDVALRALALAEVRSTPMAVWEELTCALGEYRGGSDAVASALEEARDLLVLDGETVSFREERVAEELRRAADSAEIRAVNARMVVWLRDWAATCHAPRGWAAAGPIGRYAAHGLAMHAVQAGVFEEVQRDGRLVAHVDQMALIEAAYCADSRWIDADSPPGDAGNLWMSGVDSLPQAEWASWLHLMSTVRGDAETAAEIERSGLALPWRVRWAHWRPPGGMRVSYVQPGPLTMVAKAPEADWPGRAAVVGQGLWDERCRVWDAETGEQLAGPWRGSVPGPGQKEPLWLPDTDTGFAPPWTDMTVWDNVEPPFVKPGLRVGDVVVVPGMGGLFAVEPADPSTFEGLGEVHGEPLVAGFGASLDYGDTGDTGSTDIASLDDLFEAETVQRLPVDEVPEGLLDEDARRVLTETGLPAFTGAAMGLVALAEEGLTELDPAEEGLSGTTTEERPVPPPGPYYMLGMWMGGKTALHGGSGRVYWARPYDRHFDDEGEVRATLVASSLRLFVELLQTYILSRCLLSMAPSRIERRLIREMLDMDVENIDEAAWESGVWAADLEEAD